MISVREGTNQLDSKGMQCFATIKERKVIVIIGIEKKKEEKKKVKRQVYGIYVKPFLGIILPKWRY